jgi:aerotaxis receptor
MTFQHSTSTFQNHSEEVRFGFDELFFSCTDERGIITGGNDVFQRVSGFEWDALLGASHKDVRHPDMPKGVFHILWSHIQKDEPAGAYILNQCENGKTYWVFAVISPVEGGYLSIRLKPSSELFDKTRELYATALEKEREGLSAEDSAEFILESLKADGFDDHGSFSAFAIGQEIVARDAALSRSSSKLTSALKAMSSQLLELSDEQEKLFDFFEAIRGIPSNMRIVASRLEPAGGPISAISQNYRLMSDEVQGHLDGFRSEKGSKRTVSSLVSAQVDKALFLAAMAELLKELQTQCDQPQSETRVLNDGVLESENREKLLRGYAMESGTAIKEASTKVLGLARASKDLRQLVTGLDSIRVLCRVEAGRLGADSVSLTPVIDQLDKFHKEIDLSLKRILEHAAKISELIDIATANSVLSIDRFGRIS